MMQRSASPAVRHPLLGPGDIHLHRHDGQLMDCLGDGMRAAHLHPRQDVGEADQVGADLDQPGIRQHFPHIRQSAVQCLPRRAALAGEGKGQTARLAATDHCIIATGLPQALDQRLDVHVLGQLVFEELAAAAFAVVVRAIDPPPAMASSHRDFPAPRFGVLQGLLDFLVWMEGTDHRSSSSMDMKKRLSSDNQATLMGAITSQTRCRVGCKRLRKVVSETT
ncbi:hypothetical protein WR25_24208 [Diploscapter pachys]|uniref:Uncharacterized protein n=1 Tax=Diploscapter pachys TaxID=2018661 RepID=A0A2A2KFM7_9BILA|nr:hypothetical protein WR25_24208 [Diploscapter pachys]